ncbi:unnamed protein product [Heligmosomoides polygyrus]|uniref:Secreted protein n=1 Tax=Heligmosomoides polygyrus TaxID=6339 RepID=A0A183FB61_HELPZ|nr:unnamed protein product [Heligmosomoides polygyrus]
MRSIFVAGFIVVMCVMANDSAEKPDSNEKTDLKASAPVPAAAGAHALGEDLPAVLREKSSRST